MKTKLVAHFGSETAALSVLPISFGGERTSPRTRGCRSSRSPCSSACSGGRRGIPGAEPGGGGYVAQRIFSARTERDGVLATLCFNVAHYALRPWPWIITGLATVILYPNGIGPNHDHEAAYVQAFVDLLPTPWRGFMMAGFAAAYMSTVGDAAQLGRVVSRERRLSPIPEERRDREALRRRVAAGDGRAVPRCRRSSRGSCRRSKARGNSCSRSAPARASCSSCAGTGGASTRGRRSARCSRRSRSR